MTVKLNSPESRIFMAAIAVSVMVHIFWISAVNITASPQDEGRVKFSKVSFLGPAVGEASLSEFKMAPQSMSSSEKRLRRKATDMAASGSKEAGFLHGRLEGSHAPRHHDFDMMMTLIETALE